MIYICPHGRSGAMRAHILRRACNGHRYTFPCAQYKYKYLMQETLSTTVIDPGNIYFVVTVSNGHNYIMRAYTYGRTGASARKESGAKYAPIVV